MCGKTPLQRTCDNSAKVSFEPAGNVNRQVNWHEAGHPAQEGMRSMATQTAIKREVTATPEKKGLSTQDLILIAVLLAAGAVLKLTVGSFFASFGMKPNFIIAMYCLAIVLTKPAVRQAVIIGLIAGLICQIPMLNATPFLNIVSETLGALVCGLLLKAGLYDKGEVNVGAFVKTFLNTFLSTVASGGTFALMAIFINVVLPGTGGVAAALAAYTAIVLGTATFNGILNTVLVPPLRKVLKK